MSQKKTSLNQAKRWKAAKRQGIAAAKKRRKKVTGPLLNQLVRNPLKTKNPEKERQFRMVKVGQKKQKKRTILRSVLLMRNSFKKMLKILQNKLMSSNKNQVKAKIQENLWVKNQSPSRLKGKSHQNQEKASKEASQEKKLKMTPISRLKMSRRWKVQENHHVKFEWSLHFLLIEILTSLV